MTDADRSYLVDTGYAAGGVTVRRGVVIEAAPVFRWMVGKPWEEVRLWKNIRHPIQETKAADPADVPGTDAWRERLEAESGQLRLEP